MVCLLHANTAQVTPYAEVEHERSLQFHHCGLSHQHREYEQEQVHCKLRSALYLVHLSTTYRAGMLSGLSHKMTGGSVRASSRCGTTAHQPKKVSQRCNLRHLRERMLLSNASCTRWTPCKLNLTPSDTGTRLPTPRLGQIPVGPLFPFLANFPIFRYASNGRNTIH